MCQIIIKPLLELPKNSSQHSTPVRHPRIQGINKIIREMEITCDKMNVDLI